MKTKPHLDYLFEADFADGTTYQQGADDVSMSHPADAEGNRPSAYKDVLDRIDDVRRFHLVHYEDNPKGGKEKIATDHYTVDLSDCHFEINGVPFNIFMPQIPLTEMELIYMRITNVESTFQTTVGEDKEVDWRGAEEVARAHYVAAYVIGFKAKQGGKEVQYSIAVKG